jgi:ABC-type phosphate/phosphonate transport system substrate-binding protein
MRRLIGAGVGLAALALVLIGPGHQGRPAGAAERKSNTIRVGVVSSFFRDTPEPLVKVVMRPFQSLLETQTGIAGEVLVGGDPTALGRKLKEDQVHLGVFHGVEFAWARLKHPTLKPLLLCLHHDRVLRAHLLVRKDSKAAVAADLEGQTVALPRESREHCRLFLERRCAKPGTCPAKFFKEVTTPADAEEALDAVVDGQVGAVVVDGVALAAYRKLKPGCAARLRTLLESEAFPCAVVAYQPGQLSEGFLRSFRDGMIAAKTTRRGQQLLQMCRITGFEAAADDYDRLLTEIAKAYPPPAEK